MTIWTAHLAVDEPDNLTDEQLETLIDAFPMDAGAAISFQGGVSATFTVSGDTLGQAFVAANRMFRDVLVMAGVDTSQMSRAEVVRADIADAELEQRNSPELAGVAEVAALLGVSKQRVDQLRVREDFPKPLAVLASGPVWDKTMLGNFMAGWSRKPGRPSKTPTSTAAQLMAEEGARMRDGFADALLSSGKKAHAS